MMTCDICHENEATIRAEIDGMAEADICGRCAQDLEEHELEAAEEYAERVAFEREHGAA